MSQDDILRNSLIHKLMAINDLTYLKALHKIVEPYNTKTPLAFTPEQKRMLEMSEKDIENGRLISQDDLEKEITRWLNEK